MICAKILMAISAGVTAFISNPIGAKIEEICAAAETNGSVASFPKVDEAFLFLVEAGKLKVAAAGREDGDVWIIAELESEKSGGSITETVSSEKGKLTVNGSSSNPVRITSYQVVDKETAKDFVKSGGAG